MATENVGNGCADESGTTGAAYSSIATAAGSTAANAGVCNTFQAYGNQNLSGADFGSMAPDNPPLGSNPEAFSPTDHDDDADFTFEAETCDSAVSGVDFTAFSVAVGDYAGMYWSSGNIERSSTGDDYTDSSNYLATDSNNYWQRSSQQAQFRMVNTYGDAPAAVPQVIRINISKWLGLLPVGFLLGGILNNPRLTRRGVFNPFSWLKRDR